MKKILALILAATLLVFIVACDDEDEYVGGDNEIDVSIGGFFDDVEDTNDGCPVAQPRLTRRPSART